MTLDAIDVRRAYFHAAPTRRVFIKLPPENAGLGMCGLLQKSMYGTRDVAQNWEVEYSDLMCSIGFKRGNGMPCVFHHTEKGTRAVIHGDDSTRLGHSSQFDWFRSAIKSRLEVKPRGRIGPGAEDETVNSTSQSSL